MKVVKFTTTNGCVLYCRTIEDFLFAVDMDLGYNDPDTDMDEDGIFPGFKYEITEIDPTAFKKLPVLDEE